MRISSASDGTLAAIDGRDARRSLDFDRRRALVVRLPEDFENT
jgi:hypothetical protein